MRPPRWPVVLFLGVVFSASWTQVEPNPITNQTRSPQSAVEQMLDIFPLPSVESAVIIPESTAVKLRLLHSLNSKTAIVDDPLNFVLAEDIAINGKLVARAGASAVGRLRQAKPARVLGRGGQLGVEIQYLKVGRTRVPLRGSQLRSGASKESETAALAVLFGVGGLVKHGSEIEIKKGTLFTAYVDEDTELLQPEAPAHLK